MGLYNGKTTTSKPLLCSDPGCREELSDFEATNRKLNDNVMYLSIQSRLINTW